jgi:hypothetical protein
VEPRRRLPLGDRLEGGARGAEAAHPAGRRPPRPPGRLRRRPLPGARRAVLDAGAARADLGLRLHALRRGHSRGAPARDEAGAAAALRRLRGGDLLVPAGAARGGAEEGEGLRREGSPARALPAPARRRAPLEAPHPLRRRGARGGRGREPSRTPTSPSPW